MLPGRIRARHQDAGGYEERRREGKKRIKLKIEKRVTGGVNEERVQESEESVTERRAE